MKEKAKVIIINQIHDLEWYCHKNDYSSEAAKRCCSELKGMLKALFEVGAIDRSYFVEMRHNANRLLNAAEKKNIKNPA